MCVMSDSLYPPQFGRNSNQTPEWTPQSAVRPSDLYFNPPQPNEMLWRTPYSQPDQVSSFNFPVKYDSTLTTPVSLNADSPTVQIKRPSSIHRAWMEHNNFCYSPRDSRSPYSSTQSPMKSKGSSLSLSVSDADMSISISPYVFDSPQLCPPTPYFGSFGVSAPQDSAATSPSINSNPTPQASSTPTYNHAPILSAPVPGQLKRNHEITPIQQQQPFQQRPPLQRSNSLKQELSPTESVNPSVKTENDTPTSAYSVKRQRSSLPPSANPGMTPDVETTRSGRSGATLSAALLAESTEEERLLLRLRDEHEPYLDWKGAAAKFNEITGKHHNIPALQMRYFRHKERLRIWTDEEIKSLTTSKRKYDEKKWETISTEMLNNGCTERWSARACQMKFAELFPNEYDASPALGHADEKSVTLAMRNDDLPRKEKKRRRNTGGVSAQNQGIQSAPQSAVDGATTRSASGDGKKRVYEQQQAWSVAPQTKQQQQQQLQGVK